MNASIASVTVATNAAAALPLQLDALLNQTKQLQEIIVVDNCSSDGTRDLLSKRYPQVTHLRLPSNRGVGGGYAAGIDYAVLQKGHEWAWLLDDDSVPAPNALEKLLEAWEETKEAGEKIGILASLPVEKQTGRIRLGSLWRSEWIDPGPEVLSQRFWSVDAVISSGSMVRREAVEMAGLPRADFFMDFVDYEYCLRIRNLGYKVVTVPESILHHALGTTRKVKFLGRSREWTEHDAWREYYIWRNSTFVIWHLHPAWRSKLYLFRKFLRHASGIVLFNEAKRMSLLLMGVGFWDGIRGKLGIRFSNNSPGCNRKSPAVTHSADIVRASGPAAGE